MTINESAFHSSKRNSVSADDASSSGSTGRDDEKTIPFLRRLRDMLTENEGSISFVAGQRGSKSVLGKIVVHDRVAVEAQVLPRYFNHSSFASLRRQLNYFSFVRLGKGRQRESTYINESVIELDDILHLKRRPAGSSAAAAESLTASMPVPESIETHHPVEYSSADDTRTTKRRRLSNKKTTKGPGPAKDLPDRSSSPTRNLVSEDEHSESKQQYIALDLTVPLGRAEKSDSDLLSGCTALLGLSSQRWI